MPKRSTQGLIPWVAVLSAGMLALIMRKDIEWLSGDGRNLNAEIVATINIAMGWFIRTFKSLFDAISWVLEWPLVGLQGLLHWLPWSVTLTGFTALAYVAGRRWLAWFTAGSLLYIVLTGYWSEGMNTLALVGVSMPLAVVFGFWLGAVGCRSKRAEKIILPCMDLMQTVPTFAYLIPILLLFGFGPVVGVIASAIYACPPMVRNTMHGLRHISPNTLESGMMSGTTPRQQFWWVKVPVALPQIMVGVNQTIMATLSMVIIAAIIGGFDDIGWEVLSTMRKAQFGQSLLAGLVIVLIAMMMDRISFGFTKRARFLRVGSRSVWVQHRILLITLTLMAVAAMASIAFPFLDDYPTQWNLYPADTINRALTYMVVNFGDAFEQIKWVANFFFLLPIKIGLIGSVRPVPWGYEFGFVPQVFYWTAVAGLVVLMLVKYGWRSAVSVIVMGVVIFYGLSNIPWVVFFSIVSLVAWQAGGWRIALFAALSMLFIQFAGVWKQAMLSVYLCGAAVALSFIIGGGIGICAALNSRVSNIIRPINDTLQTMPQFVYLIPVLFLFQIGDFSALIAVTAYAIVPMIRYTEHGIRNIDVSVLEASHAMGCTRWQILSQVQLQMALPEIMLGLNQTIMYGLAMLVIAALVGTRGLGQSVYIALGQADIGKGMVAGVSIALIAMVTDRIIQAWASKKKAQLGLV